MNMKKLEYILLGLLVGFAMGACSSDDENAGVVDPVFPESQSYEIIPDQVCEISFEASTEWRVTTDKQWLKFIDETGKFQSLTGKAGKQTVKVTATNGALGFTDDKAQVKLTMGGKTQTIAEMNRAAKERVAKMYTVKGSDIIEINELSIIHSTVRNKLALKPISTGRLIWLLYPAGFSAKAQKAVSSRIYVEKPVKPSVTTEWAV